MSLGDEQGVDFDRISEEILARQNHPMPPHATAGDMVAILEEAVWDVRDAQDGNMADDLWESSDLVQGVCSLILIADVIKLEYLRRCSWLLKRTA